jgi:hypothetical protein
MLSRERHNATLTKDRGGDYEVHPWAEVEFGVRVELRRGKLLRDATVGVVIKRPVGPRGLC